MESPDPFISWNKTWVSNCGGLLEVCDFLFLLHLEGIDDSIKISFI